MGKIRYFLLRQQAKKFYFQAIKLMKKQHMYFSQTDKVIIKAKLEAFQGLILSKEPLLDKKHLAAFKLFKAEKLDLKGAKKWQHFVLTTLGALAAALIIRQMWFELYKVPTGSMRPTIKELDHLTVSKLNFSLNVPFTPAHFYFDPNLVKRSSICVFTSENMDVSDSDTLYFYCIPGKKLLVKRLIAKPGDVIYFYGGKLYGVDAAGRDISSELSPKNIEAIDHIPFIQWFGEKEAPFDFKNPTLYHMNAPFIELGTQGQWHFKIPKELQTDKSSYGLDLSSPWGINNFATARILNTQTKSLLYPRDTTFSSKGLYLELKHHLHAQKDTLNASVPLGLETSFIPLDTDLAKKLFQNLYTARFEVQNGALRRYGSTLPFNSKQLPHLNHIPDGTYEFYYGKAYKVLFGGLIKALDASHPIYRFSPTALEVFFNLGIEFNTYFVPGRYESWAPPRYAYFQDKTLFVMGMPFINSSDVALQNFIASETTKQTLQANYTPFLDQGAPYLSNGELDTQKIYQYGLRIPEKMYLALGDNHAQSADSRVFGFVPQDNLKGCPDIIFWPFGSRWGHLPQQFGQILNLPRAVIWSSAWVLTVLWLRRKKKREILPQDLSLLDK